MIFIMLPAYNEEHGIRQVLNRVHELAKSSDEPFRVVVVDDGSHDRTSVYVRSFSGQLDLKLIAFPENRGVAEVFKAGLKYVCSESVDPENDICVVLDSDNTQDPRVMMDMVKNIRQGEDLVIASRFVKGGSMRGLTIVRWIYSLGLSWLMQIAIRLPHVKDYSMFYRAYRVNLLKRGFEAYGDDLLAGRGFSGIGGLLIRLSNFTSRIKEVPLILRYGKKRGASGIKVRRTILGYFELILECFKTDRFRKTIKYNCNL